MECIDSRLLSTTVASPCLVWCPDPSQNICARVNACAREGEKGLVNNYASPQAKATMLERGWYAITNGTVCEGVRVMECHINSNGIRASDRQGC